MVKDNEVSKKIMPMIIELAKDENRQNELKNNIRKFTIMDADRRIAEEILKLI